MHNLEKSTTVDVEPETVDLVKEFADAFAVNDLDPWKCSAIEHCIDTGDARFVKQRMRRIPMVVMGRRKVIWSKCWWPDWSSRLSEIGRQFHFHEERWSVHWCVDYIALNKVTVKDTLSLSLIVVHVHLGGEPLAFKVGHQFVQETGKQPLLRSVHFLNLTGWALVWAKSLRWSICHQRGHNYSSIPGRYICAEGVGTSSKSELPIDIWAVPKVWLKV